MKKINLDGAEIYTTDEFTKVNWMEMVWMILAGIVIIVVAYYTLNYFHNYLALIMNK